MRTITLLSVALLCSVAFATTTNAQEVERTTAAQVTAADSTNSQSQTEPSAAAGKQRAAKTVASADRSTTLPLHKFTFISKRSPSSSVTEATKPVETEPQDTPTNTTAQPVAQQPAAPAPADDAAALAKKLSNPIASLISFPIQTSFDLHIGTDSGWRMTMNVQPVIPVALSPKWNLISRTIVPIIHQGGVVAPGTSQSGLGDIIQSFFFSPNKSEPFIWGVGPVILVPTATDKLLGSKQLGFGPTFVVLKQQKGLTIGMLYNHIWKVAGGEGRAKVNSDFFQPFLSFGTKDGWTYQVNTESSYDWTSNTWAVPVHFQVSKIVRLGKQPMSFAGALRCWATSPTGGPKGCGLRFTATALFPTK